MSKIKKLLLMLWKIDSQIRIHIAIAKFFYNKVPIIGRPIGLIMDRWLFIVYGIYLYSFSVNVKYLTIVQPNGVNIAGHGLYSPGRVSILHGVRMTVRKPGEEKYVELYKKNRVFDFGDNVVIGVGTIVVGPIKICDNVMVGAGSLVLKDITEPGVYVGNPLRKVKDTASDIWFQPSVGIKKDDGALS